MDDRVSDTRQTFDFHDNLRIISRAPDDLAFLADTGASWNILLVTKEDNGLDVSWAWEQASPDDLWRTIYSMVSKTQMVGEMFLRRSEIMAWLSRIHAAYRLRKSTIPPPVP